MKTTACKIPANKSVITELPVVRNFQKVIGSRDILYMNEELYEFLQLHCGFIAHCDINGFKATYSRPVDFTNVFIRHFDLEHRYFNGVYPCHEEPYKDTGFKKADIKREFSRIVEIHKKSISEWAEQLQREERAALYQKRIREYETNGIAINCETCGNEYLVTVVQEGQVYTDFRTVCCLFCGSQIKLLIEEVM